MKLEHGHSPEEIADRIAAENRPSYLKDMVYGGIDGAVTTFAIVAGVVGASLSANIVLILGVANLFADGFSMAAGNYSGTKADRDNSARIRSIEERHIDQHPAGEREEVRQLLAAKGIAGRALEESVAAITAKRERWIAFMMAEEYGLAPVLPDPVRAAMATFFAFGICGLVPLLPFFFAFERPFVLSVVLTGLVFFAIGTAKSRWSLDPWWRSGLETLSIGAVAASVAYGVGYLLGGLA